MYTLTSTLPTTAWHLEEGIVCVHVFLCVSIFIVGVYSVCVYMGSVCVFVCICLWPCVSVSVLSICVCVHLCVYLYVCVWGLGMYLCICLHIQSEGVCDSVSVLFVGMCGYLHVCVCVFVHICDLCVWL